MVAQSGQKARPKTPDLPPNFAPSLPRIARLNGFAPALLWLKRGLNEPPLLAGQEDARP